MMDSDKISLKVKKKIGNKHNKNIKYLPQKYDEKICEELKSKLTISKKKKYYGFIPFYNKFPKEESRYNKEALYINISYFYLRDRNYFKVIEINDKLSIFESFFELFPEMKDTDLKEKHFISMGKIKNIELYLVRFQPSLLSNGLSFSNVPPKRNDIFAWDNRIDLYSVIKNSKKKIYKQILENGKNYLLDRKFFPDLNVDKESLEGFSLEYLYKQIISLSDSPEIKKKILNNKKKLIKNI